MTTKSNPIINPFDKIRGSAILSSRKGLLFFFLGVGLVGLILAKMELTGVALVTALFFGGIYIYLLFKNPILGFYMTIGIDFVILGVGRYIQIDLPIGFSVDGSIILTFLAIIFSKFRERVDW